MLYRIGTEQELAILSNRLPERTFTDLVQCTVVLDAEYGEERDYLEVGGYSLVVETAEDLEEAKKIINYDTHPCEWAIHAGKGTGYIEALYLLNDDYSIMLFLPQAIAPDTILNDLEEDHE